MELLKEEIAAIFSKIWVWILYVAIGLMAKFSYDIIRGKKITMLQALGSSAAALAVGTLASIGCANYGHEKAGVWIVPAATLLSEKIIIAASSIEVKDIKKFMADVASYWADKFKK